MTMPEGLFALPKHFPLCDATRKSLTRAQPPSKITYADNHIKKYLNDIEKTLIETVSVKLELATNKFELDLIDKTEYEGTRERILNSLIDGDWIGNIYESFASYADASDAYTLMLTEVAGTMDNELSVDNLQEYVSNERKELAENGRSSQMSISQSLQDHQKITKLASAETLKDEIQKHVLRLKQIIFVSIYPERPIPSRLEVNNLNEENNDEDGDLQVDGGKVNLTCPISRELFKKPYKSLNCSHTYDLDALQIYLRSSHECPECGAGIGSRSIEPDIIMSTRVKCYLRDKEITQRIKGKTDNEVDRL